MTYKELKDRQQEEINGNLVGKYEGYELKSMAKTAQGNMVAIQITFSKEI